MSSKGFETLARYIGKAVINKANKPVGNLAETQTGLLMVGLRVLTGYLERFYCVADYKSQTSESARSALTANAIICIFKGESILLNDQ